MADYIEKPKKVQAIFFDGTNIGEVAKFCGFRKGDNGEDIQKFNPIGTYIPQEEDDQVAEMWLDMASGVIPIVAPTWIVSNGIGLYTMDESTFEAEFEAVVTP